MNTQLFFFPQFFSLLNFKHEYTLIATQFAEIARESVARELVATLVRRHNRTYIYIYLSDTGNHLPVE